MHPLLAIGLLVTVAGVFADALGIDKPGTKTIKIAPKEKKTEAPPAEKTEKKPASDSLD